MKKILILSLITTFAAQAAISFNSSVPGYISLSAGTDGPVGLKGYSWNYDNLFNQGGTGSRISVSGTTLANGGFAFTDQNGYSSAPDGTFNATTLNYSGGNSNTQSVISFLGTDGGSFVGVDDGNYGDTLFRFQGYIKIANPNTVINGLGLRSDDGSRFYIDPSIDILATANGGTGSVGAPDNDGGHAAQTYTNDVTFVDAGYYPVDIRYFEGAWASEDGTNFGGGVLTLRVNGADYNPSSPQITLLQSVTPIPEPTTVALAGLALLGLGRRRRA